MCPGGNHLCSVDSRGRFLLPSFIKFFTGNGVSTALVAPSGVGYQEGGGESLTCSAHLWCFRRGWRSLLAGEILVTRRGSCFPLRTLDGYPFSSIATALYANPLAANAPRLRVLWSLTEQWSEFLPRKPQNFHYHFFLLDITTFIMGLLGLPAPNGLIPQAPIHTASLVVWGQPTNKKKATGRTMPG